MTQKTGRSEDITSLLGQIVDRIDRLEASMPSTRGKKSTKRQARGTKLCVFNVAARATGNRSVCGPDPEDQHPIPPAKFVNKMDTVLVCVRKLKFGKLIAPGSGSALKVCGVKTKSAGECVNSVNDVSVCDSVDENVGDFMYMDVLIKGTKVAALLDTGSSINIISKSLYTMYIQF